MRLSSEAALMLLALALYLYDALVLLAVNEAVLVRRGGRWQAVFGVQHWRLAGREPCWPGLLAPHRPFVPLAWSFEAERATPARRPLEAVAGRGMLALCSWLSAFTLFGLLPLALFGQAGSAVTLAVLALLYAVNLTALVLLYRIHRGQGGPAARYWSTAFECLVCPPFCLNLMRRACAWDGVDEDLLQACKRLLPPAALARAQAQCVQRLDEQIACEDEHSPRLAALQRRRAQLLPREAAT